MRCAGTSLVGLFGKAAVRTRCPRSVGAPPVPRLGRAPSRVPGVGEGRGGGRGGSLRRARLTASHRLHYVQKTTFKKTRKGHFSVFLPKIIPYMQTQSFRSRIYCSATRCIFAVIYILRRYLFLLRYLYYYSIAIGALPLPFRSSPWGGASRPEPGLCCAALPHFRPPALFVGGTFRNTASRRSLPRRRRSLGRSEPYGNRSRRAEGSAVIHEPGVERERRNAMNGRYCRLRPLLREKLR